VKPFSRARWIGHSGLKERVGRNKSFALEGYVLVRVSNFQQNLEGNLDERRPKRLTEIRIQEHKWEVRSEAISEEAPSGCPSARLLAHRDWDPTSRPPNQFLRQWRDPGGPRYRGRSPARA
jgi:hypothetical protein